MRLNVSQSMVGRVVGNSRTHPYTWPSSPFFVDTLAAGIKFVDFLVAADLNVPTEAFVEDPISKPMHFREVVDELAVALGVMSSSIFTS